MISDRDRKQLSKALEKLQGEVNLVMFTQETECEFCKDTRQLVEELAAVDPRIKATVYDFVKDREIAREYGVDKIPAIALFGKRGGHVHFYGIPAGYEFYTLVQDIIDASRGETSLTSKTLEALKTITKPVHIQVFVTPTCPYCPSMVRLAHQFALENPLIKSDMIEVTEFPHLAFKYRVESVPKTMINDSLEMVGQTSEEQLVEYVLKATHRPSTTI